jgi:hypothetical protein
VLHTLPVSAIPASSSSSAKAPSEPEKTQESNAKQSTINIPRLISVGEIIKREYLKASRTSRVGLHQYNDVGCLEDLGIQVEAEHREEAEEGEDDNMRMEKAEEERRRQLTEVLAGKRQ